MDLLERLAHWTRTPRADGAELAGPDGARIVLRAGVCPIPRLADLIAAETGTRAGAVERFATLEGEPAALASGPGWAIGLVPGDDRAHVVIGRGDVTAVVRELARHAFHGLGELRRRWFAYEPPAGWRGLARPYAARWLAPDYPRVRHAVVVFHARPGRATPPELVDRLLVTSSTHGRLLEPPRPLAPVALPCGLAGTYARIDHRTPRGDVASVVRCTLQDDRFAYVVELSGPAATIARDLPVLERLVATIEPVARAQLADLSARVLYWGD